MITYPRTYSRPKRKSNWQEGFLTMVPDIVKQAEFVFRNTDTESHGEAIQEVLVSSMLAYIRLFELQKTDVAYPSVLARYAVAQYRAGRRVSAKLNGNDVLSQYAQQKRGFRVQSLNIGKVAEILWDELLLEDEHAGPAETAAARIDFTEWFASLSRFDNRIARALSVGCRTCEVAEDFHLSSARISQKRRELLDSWERFQGEGQADSELT